MSTAIGTRPSTLESPESELDLSSEEALAIYLFTGQGNGEVKSLESFTGSNGYDGFSIIEFEDVTKVKISDISENEKRGSVLQPAIVLNEALAYNEFKKTHPVIESISRVSIGHSLGEYASLYSGGFISLDNIIRTAHTRGNATDNIGRKKDEDKQGMWVTIGESDTIQKLIDADEQGDLPDGLYIANFNTRGQVVLSGFQSSMASLKESELIEGVKIKDLRGINRAFHTPLMFGASARLSDLVTEDEFRYPEGDVPRVYSPTLEKVINNPNLACQCAVSGLKEQVKFLQTVQTIIGELGGSAIRKVGVFEFGPTGTLNGLFRSVIQDFEPITNTSGHNMEFYYAFMSKKGDAKSEETRQVVRAIST